MLAFTAMSHDVFTTPFPPSPVTSPAHIHLIAVICSRERKAASFTYRLCPTVPTLFVILVGGFLHVFFYRCYLQMPEVIFSPSFLPATVLLGVLALPSSSSGPGALFPSPSPGLYSFLLHMFPKQN